MSVSENEKLIRLLNAAKTCSICDFEHSTYPNNRADKHSWW